MAKKNQKNTVKDVLKQVPEKELRKFVEKELGIEEVLDDFMSEFKRYFLKGDTGEAYISQLTSAFIDAEGDYGSIEYVKDMLKLPFGKLPLGNLLYICRVNSAKVLTLGKRN